MTLEMDVEQDGQKGIVRVAAEEKSAGELVGQWEIVDTEGAKLMGGDWKASKEASYSLPGAWASVAALPEGAEPLIEAFWPGALTMVFRRPKAIFKTVSPGETIAIRIPASGFVTKLIARMARPLAVTSANLSGEAAPRHHPDVLSVFDGRIEAVLEGSCPADVPPSSVLDVSGEPFRLLREGHVTRAELAKVLSDGTEIA